MPLIPYELNKRGWRGTTKDVRWQVWLRISKQFPKQLLSRKLELYHSNCRRDNQSSHLTIPVTQFTNFKSAYYTWVINTGTKNWLFQYDSSIGASRIWQIPDTQTSAAIAPTSETFLQGIVLPPANQSSSDNVGIVGNYIIANKKVYRVDDNLTVLAYKGYSDGSQFSNGSRSYWKYMNVDYVAFEQRTAFPNPLSLSVANLTASNFSTPITLAAGDVLSVSYSISVGE